jgi:hypothetical protein
MRASATGLEAECDLSTKLAWIAIPEVRWRERRPNTQIDAEWRGGCREAKGALRLAVDDPLRR